MSKPNWMKSKKQKEKEKERNISSNQVRIKVYMRFGAEIRQKRAEYAGVEQRDNYNNLVVINEEYDHNEDTDFSQEDVYEGMNVTLGIAGLDKAESLKKITDSKAKHKKRISALEKHPELNKFANIWDQKRKLRELEIFENYISHRSPHGAYFKIENGIRVYEFESIDGFLIPIWHGSDNLSDYPDFTRKKKITMQETANLVSYLDNKGFKKIAVNALLAVLLITVGLFIVNVFGGFKLLDEHQELADRCTADMERVIESSAKSIQICTEVYSSAVVKTIQNMTAEDELRNNPPPTTNIRDLIPSG